MPNLFHGVAWSPSVWLTLSNCLDWSCRWPKPGSVSSYLAGSQLNLIKCLGPLKILQKVGRILKGSLSTFLMKRTKTKSVSRIFRGSSCLCHILRNSPEPSGVHEKTTKTELESFVCPLLYSTPTSALACTGDSGRWYVVPTTQLELNNTSILQACRRRCRWRLMKPPFFILYGIHYEV